MSKFGAHQAGSNPAHRGWLHLLGLRQFSQGFRAAEHKYGERRQLRWPDAAFTIANAQATQQMNGRRVQPIGGFQSLDTNGRFGRDLHKLVSYANYITMLQRS